jgi:hypothetical protein
VQQQRIIQRRLLVRLAAVHHLNQHLRAAPSRRVLR